VPGEPQPTVGGTTANGWLTHRQPLAVPPPTVGTYHYNNHINYHLNYVIKFRAPLRFARRAQGEDRPRNESENAIER
jgi:hypothetical protein